MSNTVVGQADLAFQSNLYESGNATRRWIHQRRHAWVISKLRQYAPSVGKTAFDCGVGCGVYSREMVQMGLEVVAVDVNEDFVRAASTIPGVKSYLADVCRTESLPVSASADIAVCSEVLEHVPAPAVALNALNGALRQGGILVLTTPQKWSTTELVARLLKIKLFESIARAIYKEPVQELGHISLFTQGQLQGMIEAAGFEVVEHEVFSFYLPVIAEFGGSVGQKLLAAMERGLRAIPGLRALVWTQAYVLRKL